MNKLPKELLFKIMSYTYEIQDKSMLEDIRSFHESRQIIYAIYLEKWGHSKIEHHADWIINDIGIFMNDNIPSMFGYCKKCKDIGHYTSQSICKKCGKIYYLHRSKTC